MLFVFAGMTLNAQIFLGGNIGFSSTGGSVDNGNTTTDKPTTYSFNISPMMGEFKNENLAYGLVLNFIGGRTESSTVPNLTVTTTNTFGIAPFLRYYAVRMNKFSVFGQGNVGFSYTGSKTKVGGVSTDGPKTNMLYLNIFPGLSYDVSNRLSLETNINILNFGITYTSVKSGNSTDRTTNFGIGAGLSNIVRIGDITLGAIYKF